MSILGDIGIGALVGTVGGGIGSAVGGVGGLIYGGLEQNAEAQTAAGQAEASAAQAEVDLAKQALQQQVELRQQGIQQAQAAAQMSPGEIQSITNILDTQRQALSSAQQSINMQQQKLDAMDPQVKAAGQNLYGLLSGQSTAILAPLQQQQQIQRQAMVNQLASTMGPGWATSSAGIAAMTQFDNQAAITLNSAQMNAIQTVGAQYQGLTGQQQQGEFGVTQATGAAFGAAQTSNAMVQQGYQVVQQRMTNATIGAMGANPINPFGVPGAQQAVVATAGLPYAGAAALGQGLAQAGGAGLAIGGQIAGNFAGGAGKMAMMDMQGNAGSPNAGGSPGIGSMVAQVPQMPNFTSSGGYPNLGAMANPYNPYSQANAAGAR